jgi:hypothetical protein
VRGGQSRFSCSSCMPWVLHRNIGVAWKNSESAPRCDRHQYPTPLSTTPMSLPPEIVDYIIDLTDFWTLRACSLVAKSWVARSRIHLFRAVRLISYRNRQKVIPVGLISSAIYTRTLTVIRNSPPAERCVNTDLLDQFLPYLRDFKNVENLILIDCRGSPPLSEDRVKKYFGHFGARLRSLELNGEGMSSDSFLALLGLFPNLEDLFVDERIRGAEESVAPAVPPKLSGRLTMGVYTPDLFPTLCKFPLRFREICLHEGRCDYQELINACAKTLVNLQVDVGLCRWRFEISSSRPNSSQMTYHATSPSGSAKRSGG